MSEEEWFMHPRRFVRNVEGPFYTTGVDASDCVDCGAPEAAAPTLLASDDVRGFDTFFVRQPRDAAEVEQACRAAETCCLSAIRYGGRDRAIIRRLGNDAWLCDFVVRKDGSLVKSNAVLEAFAPVEWTWLRRWPLIGPWLAQRSPARVPGAGFTAREIELPSESSCPTCGQSHRRVRRLSDGRSFVCSACGCSWVDERSGRLSYPSDEG